MSPFPRSDYAALRPYRPDRRPVEIDLSDNTNLRGPHPSALDVVRAATGESLARYPSVYADALRDEVAARFGLPKESVTTGCGSDDLLDSLFRAAGEPGDRVTYLDPTFSMIPVFGAMNGVVPRAVPGIPLPSPGSLLDGDPAVVYLCSPNNPTGENLPEPWVDALLAEASTRSGGGPLVVLDEAYADFSDGGWLSRAPERPRLVVIRTLSKSYGLAGLRVGFAAGDPVVIRELEKSRGPYKVGRVAEAAAIAALSDEDGWTRRGIQEVREARGRMEAALRERGLSPLPSDANFLLVPVPQASTLTAALREEGVAVRPFPAVTGIGDAVRVSVGRWDYMERFLDALDRVIGNREIPVRTSEEEDLP